MKLVATLDERLDNLREEGKRFSPEIIKNQNMLIELSTKMVNVEQQQQEFRIWKEALGLAAIQKDIALLAVKVDGLEKAAENAVTRKWAIWTVVIGAVLGSGVTGVITYYIATHGSSGS